MTNPVFNAATGRWTIPKDPDDIRFYWGCITQDLTDTGSTAASVVEVVGGVTVVTPTILVQIGADTWCKVKLSGLDTTLNALNFCTFRVTCANGEQFDRTLWFTREDH